MIFKSARAINLYLSNCFVEMSTDWDDLHICDIPNFIVTNNNSLNFEGGFEHFCSLQKKEDFYHLANQCLNIIYDFANLSGERFCCVGPFHRFNNYEHWIDLEKFDAFNDLTEQICNEQYLLVQLSQEKNFIGLIIENNFRYFSKISLLFPKSNVLIEPTHNAEIAVYAKDYERTQQLFSSLLDENWYISD